MNASEKTAYLKGLMEGMNYDKASNEGKLFAAIADILDELSMTTQDLEERTGTLSDYIEEIDEDLGAVEEDLYCDDDDDDEYDDDDDDDDFIEVECPHCGESVYFDEDIDPEHIQCPACGKEFSCVCDCDCDDCHGDCND